MQDETRGSARLFMERFERGIPDDAIERLVKVLDDRVIDIRDIWIKGQPPRIDDLTGVVRVDRSRLGEVVQALVDVRDLNLDVLIRGQPPRLQDVDIQFQTPGQR